MTDAGTGSETAIDHPAHWQRRWHEILDIHAPEEDDAISQTGSPQSLPDVGDDSRLHTAFWSVGSTDDADARRQLISILPAGELMLARLEAHLSRAPETIDADQARLLLRQGLMSINSLNLEAPEPDAPVRLLDESLEPLLSAFATADSPFIHFRDMLGELAQQHSGQVGMQAFYFLSEPLYQLAASYEVADWIRWPLCAAPDADDPTLPIYQLAVGGWSAGWDSQGLFLFDRRHEVQKSR
ncbi:hypothetical protein FXN63_07420 [Pigmentiphaga aceris]|uniref:Uncharacterized protein n=1 Tax=Pigmentiphaga aceris TaxID=1940612 RepID=A0A5C0AXY5_9BURK|nr:hypothetical protein [Pigmentiphaga aceris]QEI05690.1 hypothetical protein FXN63_07420 [Pigmentiphaga aceris]